VYFNHEEGRTLLLETFLSPTYLNTTSKLNFVIFDQRGLLQDTPF
jgi:hypothetical protein